MIIPTFGSSYNPRSPGDLPVSDSDWITMYKRPRSGSEPLRRGGGYRYSFAFDDSEDFAEWWKSPSSDESF